MRSRLSGELFEDHHRPRDGYKFIGALARRIKAETTALAISIKSEVLRFIGLFQNGICLIRKT